LTGPVAARVWIGAVVETISFDAADLVELVIEVPCIRAAGDERHDYNDRQEPR
jgi:hypothetical protein